MIPKCYDCLFVYLPEFLFLKLCNNCRQIRVGVVLSEHGNKCLAGCQTKAKGKVIILLINNVVYTSILILRFSLTESFHQLLIV